MHKFVGSFLMLSLAAGFLRAQTLQHRSEKPPNPRPEHAAPALALAPVPLTIAAGTPLKLVLDQEVRVRKAGQHIHGKTTEPIYAFDKLLIPAGSEVNGRITEIDSIPKKTRTLAAMNANFSPQHKLQIELDDLVAPDGKHLAIHTVLAPDLNRVLQFVPAHPAQAGKVAEGKNLAKGRLEQARQELRKQLASFKSQLSSPQKAHRLERFALAQSPYRPQYLDAGTSFSAAVPQPLTFGSEHLKPEMVRDLGQLPATGGTVHAWLSTPLSSATSKKGDQVEATISQPLIVDHKLYLPEGSDLKGTVLQVRPARRLGHNGQLRIAFRQVVPPSGLEQEIQSTLEGVEAAKGENLALDSEGGAQVKPSKSRYLTTSIAVMLAASSASPDEDRFRHGGDGGGGGDLSGGALNGASGFKLVGTLVGVFARSRSVATGFGAYGAARSIYSHFLAKGHDVVYPKNMSMVIALGSREKRASN